MKLSASISENLRPNLRPKAIVLVNRYKRALRCPGILGARIQEGLTGSSASAGMGDCLLLDFSRDFFAVADGSERNPSASREFMKLFAAMLTRIISPSGPEVYGKKRARTLKRQVITETDRLLQTLPFGDGCTFTGILLLRTEKGMTGLLFHTGDSLLFFCNVQTGESRQWSKNNFWMVGRTAHLFQVEELPVSLHTRLLLATDGLAHIPFPPSRSREETILKLFQTFGPDEIPDRLLEKDEPLSGGWDDTAVIALDPYSLPILSGCFLFGGTSRTEESIFQEEKKQGLYQDRYHPSVGMEEDRSKPIGL